jgi:hypothetical protein
MYSQSDLNVSTLHRPTPSPICFYTMQLQCLICCAPANAGLQKSAIFSTLILGLAGNQTRTACTTHIGTNHSAIHSDDCMLATFYQFLSVWRDGHKVIVWRNEQNVLSFYLLSLSFSLSLSLSLSHTDSSGSRSGKTVSLQ